MGQPAKKRNPATYADYAAVPETQRAEIIDGTLYVFPRPAPRHIDAVTDLAGELKMPFDRGRGGPGGGWIMVDPEIHLLHEQPVVPDLAGWRRDRMPELPETAHFPLAPDWICEVLSPSTATYDREQKMPLYARHGVRFAWLVEPADRTLEVFTLGEDKRWSRPTTYRGAERVRVVPFDAIELDLSVLWPT